MEKIPGQGWLDVWDEGYVRNITSLHEIAGSYEPIWQALRQGMTKSTSLCAWFNVNSVLCEFDVNLTAFGLDSMPQQTRIFFLFAMCHEEICCFSALMGSLQGNGLSPRKQLRVSPWRRREVIRRQFPQIMAAQGPETQTDRSLST